MPEPIEGTLRQAVAFLEKHGYRYAVIGGIANQLWGRARFTFDVDIKVLVPDTDYASVRTAIRSAFPERGRPNAPANPLIVDVQIGKVKADFLLSIPGYEENIITRAVRRNLGRLSVWVCSAEDLIIQKVIANRGKDWQDVEGILAEQFNRLDYGYIENWLSQFVEILEQPEMLETYHTTRQRVDGLMSKKD